MLRDYIRRQLGEQISDADLDALLGNAGRGGGRGQQAGRGGRRGSPGVDLRGGARNGIVNLNENRNERNRRFGGGR